MKSTFKIFFFSCILLAPLFGCKKFVEADVPKTLLVSSTVFADNSTANAAQTAIYSKMLSDVNSYFIPMYTGLSSDELSNYATSQDIQTFFSDNLSPGNARIQALWTSAYGRIFQANSVIEGLQKSSMVTPDVKKQLLGEAEFIRAFWHFYLVNFFGEIPIITSTDYTINKLASRTTVLKVYQQILSDLLDAQSKLNASYVAADGISISQERVRPTKWAAAAMLARVYLYMGDYKNAETEATAIINNTGTFNLESDINAVFLKNSTEAIWELQSVIPSYNTPEGNNFILSGSPLSGIIRSTTISAELLNSFETGDKRRENWVGNFVKGTTTYYFPYKYKVRGNNGNPTEYSVVLRLAEEYLIRAEARANQQNSIGAIDDVNVIRARAGLPILSSSITKDQLLSAISQERLVEFFTEWGHRWFDLKRTGKVDPILSALKGVSWQPTDQLYPIPQNERNNDPNITQNPGY